MSFSAEEISAMLQEYESEHHTGMDCKQMAELIYDYTSGYPFLVSKLCKLLDENVSIMLGYNAVKAWTRAD